MAVRTTSEETLSSVADGDAPVLEQLALMNLDTLNSSGLDERTYHLARLAALVAMDAAPVSYLVNLGVAAEAGVTLDDARGALIAISPIVGSARIASSAGKLLRAYGLAEAAADGQA